jgi:hypothetical protein
MPRIATLLIATLPIAVTVAKAEGGYCSQPSTSLPLSIAGRPYAGEASTLPHDDETVGVTDWVGNPKTGKILHPIIGLSDLRSN